jgi:valyl-tRNA synthetase
VLADETADPEKGTGILMICTFGDTADVEKWRELGVPAREVIGRDGRIRPAVWGEEAWETNDAESAQRHYDKLVGLSINQARRTVAEMLGNEGGLVGEPERTLRPVKFFEKGDRPLEFVVSRQWFIKVMDKKKELIDQGRKIAWHPEMFRKRYEDWVEGLNQDWCVSRQRYFGVPIPVWYSIDGDGNVDYNSLISPSKEDLPVDPSADPPPGYEESQRGQPGGFQGDPDVFDTWATSSLTPLIPTGWPDDEKRLANLYPNDLRPQAHEIIRTWAFTTITRSYLMDGSIPWYHAAISGFVLDPDRKKMSKSKGNVVVPTQPLDDHGSDAVRYWAASSRLGVDTAVDPNVFREGKRLVTKLLNASRLVLGYEGAPGDPANPLDLSVLSRLAELIEKVTTEWEDWNHAGALDATESWFWGDFTDNYLELSKSRAYSADPSALGTLRIALDVALRLFAPVLPYVTEEIWHQLHPKATSIHTASWPSSDELPRNGEAGLFDPVVEVLTQIRKAKSEAKVSIKYPVQHLRVHGPADQLQFLEKVLPDLVSTGNVQDHELMPKGDDLVVSIALGEPPAAAG